VARYGGEELAVILPGTDLTGALAVAEKMRKAVQALQLAHPANPAGVVTISAGVESIIPEAGANTSQLLEAADRSLYAASVRSQSGVELP
jgi:diguanylate cyclase (GGDEF)-like protein